MPRGFIVVVEYNRRLETIEIKRRTSVIQDENVVIAYLPSQPPIAQILPSSRMAMEAFPGCFALLGTNALSGDVVALLGTCQQERDAQATDGYTYRYIIPAY